MTNIAIKIENVSKLYRLGTVGTGKYEASSERRFFGDSLATRL